MKGSLRLRAAFCLFISCLRLQKYDNLFQTVLTQQIGFHHRKKTLSQSKDLLYLTDFQLFTN